MLEAVEARLLGLGYTVTAGDVAILNFIIAKVEMKIQNDCNVAAVPAGLQAVAVDMAAGEFLKEKKATGLLAGFDLSAAVKEIQEGDSNVSYAYGSGSATPEQRLDALIDHLLKDGQKDLARYRCVQW